MAGRPSPARLPNPTVGAAPGMATVGGMSDIHAFTANPGFTELLAVSKGDQGPGDLIRTVLVVGVVGIVFLAWFLLRGYGKKD